MFNNLKLQTKFLLCVIMVIVLFLIVVQRYKSSNDQLTAGFSGTLNPPEVQITRTAHKMGSHMLQLRRHEKDFLLRLDMRYPQKHDSEAQSMLSDIQRIATLSAEIQNKTISVNNHNIEQYTKDYIDGFKKLIASRKARGLTHKDGLQGKFRSIVHHLEDGLKSYSIEPLYISFLLIHEVERKYLASANTIFNQQEWSVLAKALDHFSQELTKYSFAKADKAFIKKNIALYFAQLDSIKTKASTKEAFDKEYKQMKQCSQRINSFIDKHYIPRIATLLLTVRRKEKDYLLRYSKQADANKYSKATRTAIDNVNTAISLSKLDDKTKNRLLQSTNNYISVFDALVAEDLNSKQLVKDMRDSIHAVEPLIFGSEKQLGLARMAEDLSMHTRKLIITQTEKRNDMASIICVVAILAALLVSRRISLSITQPLNEVVQLSEELAAGKLTGSVNMNRRDEIGRLGSALDQAIGTLNKKISSIRDTSYYVQTESAELSDATSSLAGKINNINCETELLVTSSSSMSAQLNIVNGETQSLNCTADNVAQNSREVSDDMNVVAAAIEESRVSVSSIASASEQMVDTISEIAQSTERCNAITQNAVSAVNSANAKVCELSQASKKITTIIDSINDISDKTKILALNASIEAARAGDSGKGFAVVANEVKDLAQQTSTATLNIRQNISHMTLCNDKVVEEIKTIKTVIFEVSDIVNVITAALEEQSITVKHYCENTAQVDRGMQQISQRVTRSSVSMEAIVEEIETSTLGIANISEQCGASNLNSRKILGSSQSIRSSVKSSSANTSVLNEASSKLLKLAVDLNGMVAEFQIDNDIVAEVVDSQKPAGDEKFDMEEMGELLV
ncbi:MAG: methyl-accepting chemotaxis protein [Lentisphaeraceae bacterium]|nr:methyl-accepting chemotaxis protein [Lentisphaeraceae bacterium]